MDEYTIYCTKEQARKSLELNAPIDIIEDYDDNSTPIFKNVIEVKYRHYGVIPTAEQMIGFLRSKGMKFYFNDLTALWQVVYDTNIIGQGCSDNKELEAITIALEYLENQIQ